jgi:hypothetical protein
VCFTFIDSTINNAFKVSNNPAIQGWHTGMSMMFILDQLSKLYGRPTLAVLQLSNTVFRGPYLAADTPKVLFRRIKEWVKIALLGGNPYTDRQLVTNAIRPLLTTSLYKRPFEEWDQFTRLAQTWIALQTNIQEAFQGWLNATAPTASSHGYAQAQPFRQNAFGALEANNMDKESVDGSITTWQRWPTRANWQPIWPQTHACAKNNSWHTSWHNMIWCTKICINSSLVSMWWHSTKVTKAVELAVLLPAG